MIINQKMKTWMLSFPKLICEVNPPHLTFLEILSSPLIQQEECTFLAVLASSAQSVRRTDFLDDTGYECFVNQIHLSDFLPLSSQPTLEIILKEGIALGKALFAKLSEELPWIRFRLIFSVEEEEGTLRFHTMREQESWLANDVEEYQQEGLLILDTPSDLNESVFLTKKKSRKEKLYIP